MSFLQQPSCELQAFFQRWWRIQNPTIQAEVRKLVDAGQLEFVYEALFATLYFADL